MRESVSFVHCGNFTLFFTITGEVIFNGDYFHSVILVHLIERQWHCLHCPEVARIVHLFVLQPDKTIVIKCQINFPTDQLSGY